MAQTGMKSKNTDKLNKVEDKRAPEHRLFAVKRIIHALECSGGLKLSCLKRSR
jgi:hypothetical protein